VPPLFHALGYRLCPNLFEPPPAINPKGDLGGVLQGSLVSITHTFAYGLLIGGALGPGYSGLGLIVALCGSVIVGLIAAFFGGGPFSVAGPGATTTLVFTALISYLMHSPALAQTENPALIALSLAGAAVVLGGMLQMLLSVLRIGRLARYVPLPVVAGFVNASALLIILSQVWPATGMVPQTSILELFRHLDQVKPGALALALGTAMAVKVLPRLTKRLPPLFLGALAGTLLFHALDAFGLGPVLGGTLPAPRDYSLRYIGTDIAALLESDDIADLLPQIVLSAASIALLSCLDSMLKIAALDGITLRRSDGNRQLLAEGFGNALAGMFGMPSSSSSLVRSLAALNGGMASVLTPIGISVVTLAFALTMTPMIPLLSQAVIAGLLIAIGIDLVDRRSVKSLRDLIAGDAGTMAVRGDLLVVAIVVTVAMTVGMSTAVAVGVALALLFFVAKMVHSPIRRDYFATALTPHVYDDIPRRMFLERHGDKIAILEIEGTLFFGTAHALEARVDEFASTGTLHIVLDMRRVTHVESTGARALERMSSRLVRQGGMLVISNLERSRQDSAGAGVNPAARKVWNELQSFGTVNILGVEYFLGDTDSAVALCERHLLTDGGVRLPAIERLADCSELVRRLDRARVRRLRRYWRRLAFARDEPVFVQGAMPDGVYFIISGRADVLIDIPGTDRKRRVRSLTRGAVFGELALTDHKPRSASIVAVEPLACYRIDSEEFARLTREQPDLAVELLSVVAVILAERLRGMTAMLAEMEA
jgi:anti-anti-sigma factor